MPQDQRQPHRVAVVARQLARVADERGAVGQAVVLHVPLALALLRREPGTPFDEHLPLAVRLSANRVMTRDEPDGEAATVVEPHIVPSSRRQLDLRRLPPAAHLDAVVRRGFGIPGERLADVVTRVGSIRRRPEIEVDEVDGVVSGRVDATNAVEERHSGPGAFAKFVGVVVDEPVGVEVGGKLRLATYQTLQRERARAVGRCMVGERLDADDAMAHEGLDETSGAVGRAVVDQVHENAVRDEIANGKFDDVGFVIRRDDGDDSERPGHRGAL